MSNYQKALERYDRIVALCPRFERLGKTMPYTAANTHMFSILNKEGELGFRYDKKMQAEYMERFDSDFLLSHGATMNGYILITEEMLKDTELCVGLLNESYDYVLSLEPREK